MLKRIPKSDISIRPFKAYKEWAFDESSSEISFLEADMTSSMLSGDFPKNSIYGQLRAQFYNGNEDNPFTRTGHKNNIYNNNPATKDRFLSGSAKIISIPQIYVGEGIKKGSVYFIDNGSPFVDDNYGNLVAAGGGTQIFFTDLDLTGSIFNFTDLTGQTYSSTINSYFIDIQNSTFDIVLNGGSFTCEITAINNEEGVIYINNATFLAGAAGTTKLGNVFYNQGIIAITRNPNSALLSTWDLSFKSTQTIYEHEYLLIVNEDEFNVSQNPTAVVEVGKETSFITGSDNKIYRVTTNPGVKYIRKKSILEDGSILDYSIGSNVNSSISGGFDQYEYSSSLDSTGSYLAPFITTIGLYDDNCDLVAVAKLPQPIKSYPDLPVNFIIRFDT